jgi:hypothetical protein
MEAIDAITRCDVERPVRLCARSSVSGCGEAYQHAVRD